MQHHKISELFGINAPDHITLPVAQATSFTPAVDTGYVFRPELVQFLSNWLFRFKTRNLLVTGPTGSGKSSVVEQFGARLGKEVFRVACHGRMDFDQMVGHLTIKSKQVSLKSKVLNALAPFKAAFGNAVPQVEQAVELATQVPGQPEMQFELGPLPLAMMRGGILLLDEFDTLPAAVALGLNGVLDGAPLLIPQTGQRIVPHPDFRIALTGNTAGAGDTGTGGLYKGTNRQNLATMDRVLAIEVDYMDPETEERLMKSVPGMTDAFAQLIVQLANDVRHAFKQGELQATLSTRACLAWADVAISFTGSKMFPDQALTGLETVLLRKCTPEDRIAITEVYNKLRGTV